jgi:hypothetical protein
MSTESRAQRGDRRVYSIPPSAHMGLFHSWCPGLAFILFFLPHPSVSSILPPMPGIKSEEVESHEQMDVKTLDKRAVYRDSSG